MEEFARHPKSSISNSHGQTIVEYLLVLVVSIAIVLGIVWQFNQAVRDFASNYFGEYLSCLLEVGELPTFGGGQGVCENYYEPFTFAQGRPPIVSQKGRPGQRPEDSETSSSEAASKTKGTKGEGGTAGGSSSRGRVSARGIFDRRQGSEDGTETSREGDEKKSSEADTGMDASAFSRHQFSEQRRGEESQKRRLNEKEQEFFLQKEKEKKKREKAYVGDQYSKKEGGKKSNIAFQSSSRKPTAQIDEESWEFGDFIRYIIIAAILIAILLFFVGQAIQISKSWEK